MKKEDPFLVRLDEVPAGGLAVDTVPESGWAAPLLGDSYKRLGKPATISYLATCDDGRLKIRGSVELDVQFSCSRCAEDSNTRHRFDVDVLYVPESQRRIMLGDAEDDHDQFNDLFGYESNRVSVEEPFADSVVMGLAPFPVCQPECKGLCPHCGVNLNLTNCSCEPEPDSRWGPLAGLKAKLAGATVQGSKGEQNGSHQKEEIKDEDPNPAVGK